MKKTLFLALLAVPLLFCACGFDNLTVPKEVEVVTGATYEFYLAKLDSKKQEWLDFSKFLDIGKMITSDEGGSSESSENQFELYKYNTGSEYQQLLMHMPLKDIDFDFGESFSNMEFAQNMQSMDLDKDITIPDVGNLHDTKPMDLTNIKTALNTAVSFTGETAASLSIGFSGFTNVEYESGSFDIIIYPSYTGTVTLKDNGTYITSAVFSGNKASLDLAGKTIKSSGMTLEFSGASDVTFYATVNSSSSIKIARGVSLDASLISIPPVDVSFPVNMGDDIESCTIKEGSMTITIKNDAAEDNCWNSVISAYNIDVTGGITASVTKTEPTATFTDQALTKDDINAHATVELNLTNKTIDFEHPPLVDASVEVRKISATVKLPSDFKSSITEDKDIGSDVTDYVQNITWNPSGFKITAKNNLPTGNNITLSVDCPFFGIDNTASPDTIAAQGTAAEDQHFDYLCPDQTITKFVNDGAVAGTYYEKIEVTATIGLPGDQQDKISVVNVEPGKTYKVSIKVEPVMDWAKANIALKDANNTNMKGQFDSNLNKAELFKTFGDSLAKDFASNINFTATPLYLFATMPKSDKLTMFDNAKYQGTIKAYFATKSGDTVTPAPGTKTEYLVGSESEAKVIPLVGMPALHKDAEGTVDTDFSAYVETLDFSKALNLEAPSGVDGASLYLDYDIALAGGTGGAIEVTKEDMETLKTQGKSKITMDIVMIMTMKFDLTKDVNMNILEMMNKDSESGSGTKTDAEKDLFHRESATTAEDYQKYIDVVKSAELEFTKPKFPFITTGGMSLKVDWGNNEKSECILKDGVNAVVAVNPSTLMKQYPLEPKIEIVIGKGTFGLPRTMEMEAGLKIRVKAEGPIQVYPFDGSKEAN